MEITAAEQKDLIGTDFTDEEKKMFRSVRIGTYFIIPLRTAEKPISGFSLTRCETALRGAGWEPYDWEYDDLYNRINSLFRCPEEGRTRTDSPIGVSYRMDVGNALRYFGCGPERRMDENTEFYVPGQDEQNLSPAEKSFRFRCVQITVMHSGIGFLTIGIEAKRPEVHDMLSCGGTNRNRSALGIVGEKEENRPEERKPDFGVLISAMLKEIGFTDYPDCVGRGQTELLLRDTTLYSVMVLNARAHGATKAEVSEKIRALCLNLREAQALGTPTFSESDSESYSMLAAPSIENNRQWLRWGIYTAFERTTQVIFNDAEKDGRTVDPINVDASDREDNYLPFLLLALYSRYSYLFFTELLGEIESDQANMEWLEEQLFRLKASGTFIASEITPYHNVNAFMRYQHSLYELADSQKLIDSKISIISHQKAEKAEERNRYLEKFLAVFGMISILCDSVGLLDSLINAPGYQKFHLILCCIEIAIFSVFLVMLYVTEKRK